MAEFCLACFNALHGTELTESDVVLSREADICEGCGQLVQTVEEIPPLWLGWLRNWRDRFRGSVDRPISERSESAWDSCTDVSGADHGPAARGTVGTAVGGLGRSEPHVVHQQKRRAAGRKAGHQHTENAKFHPNGSSPRGHSETSCGRTRTPSCKSVFVPISAHGRDVGPRRLPQTSRQDHQGDWRGTC